jgi:hypothetical protein
MAIFAAIASPLLFSIRELNDEVPENARNWRDSCEAITFNESTKNATCAKHNPFQPRLKQISDGAWCMERFHDRPFKDFVAHETHRLILLQLGMRDVAAYRLRALGVPFA